MAKHNELGKAGENAAVTYLEQQGYIIRDRNWRKGHFELDIVATKEQELIVVEVKTRSNTQFAEPEDAVDIPKIKRIRTRYGYLYEAISNRYTCKIRYHYSSG